MKTEKSLILLVLGAIVLGAAPILVRLSEVGPLATGFWRLALSLPILGILCLQQKSMQPALKSRLNIRDYLWVLWAGVWFAADIAVWHFSLSYTTVAVATILMNCSPVFLALWHWLVLGEAPQKKLLAGLSLAIVGMVLLVKPGLQVDKGTLYGALLALLSAVFYAIYLFIISRARQKFTAISIMTLSTSTSMLSMGAMVGIVGERLMPSTLTAWWVVVGLAWLVHVLGQGLVAQALSNVPVTISAAVLLIQPVISSMVGHWLFGESLDGLQMLGVVMTLMGLYAVSQTR